MQVFIFVLLASCLLCWMEEQSAVFAAANAPLRSIYNRKRLSGFFLLACAIVLFFAVCRADAVGGDLANYKIGFEQMVARTPNATWEPAYAVLELLVSKVTSNFNVFLAVCSVLTLCPMLYVLHKENKSYLWLAMLIFLAEAYASSFSGLRLSLSYMCLYVAFHFKRTSRHAFYIVFLGLAFLFHYTSIMLIACFVLFDRRFSFYWYLMAGVATMFLALFGPTMKAIIFQLFPRYGSYLTFEYTSYVPALNLFLFVVLTVLCYFYRAELLARNPKNALLINLSAAMLCFNVGCWWFPLGIRIAQMFRYFSCFLIPEIIACEHRVGYRRLLLACFTVFYGMLFVFFVMGNNAVLPYRFFWQ